MAGNIAEGDRDRIRNALYAGRKVEAIKLYRECTGSGLKEAKAFADTFEDQLRRAEPQNFATPSASWGCGLSSILLLAACGFVVAVWS